MKKTKDQPRGKFSRKEIQALCGFAYANCYFYCQHGVVKTPPGKTGNKEKRFTNRDALLFRMAAEMNGYGMTISTIKTAAAQLNAFWETKSRRAKGGGLDWSDDENFLQLVAEVGFHLFIRRMANRGWIVSLHVGIVRGKASVIYNVLLQPNGRTQLNLIEGGKDMGVFDEGLQPVPGVDVQELMLRSCSMVWINLGGLARELLAAIGTEENLNAAGKGL